MSWFPKVREAYRCRESGEYDESATFAWIRSIGEALEVGKRAGLGTMININNDQWVAIALDFKYSLVWYGDLIGGDTDNAVKSVIDWWTFHHTGREFNYRKMKISTQADGYSCGLLGPNALGHFYLLEKFLQEM